MPRGKRGGAGAGGLGRSLVRSKGQRKKPTEYENDHTTEDVDERPSLLSLLEDTSIDDFLAQAQMADQEFIAEKQNIQILDKTSFMLMEKNILSPSEKHVEELMHHLSVPRRPAWTRQMTADVVDANERAAFLAWRGRLAEVEQNEALLLTPYEKNLQVWRQLWRVVERSDVVVQIVDSRNPLLFRSTDLETYVREVDPRKRLVLLLNKSELLSVEQRKYWAKYFRERNVRILFWSAFLAMEELRAEREREVEEEEEAKEEEVAREEDSINPRKGQKKRRHVKPVLEEEGEGEVDGEEDGEEEEENEEEEEVEEDVHDASTEEKEAEKEGERGRETKQEREEGEKERGKESEEEEGEKKREKERDKEEEEEDERKEAKQASSDSVSSPVIRFNVSVDDVSSESVRILTRKELYDEFVAIAMPVYTERLERERMEKEKEREKEKEKGGEKETVAARKGRTEDREEEEAEKGSLASRVVIGMVGYPNVGKSSTINALFGNKKVTVSATPGKTKHFQTLLIGNDIFLCDCPGLVFPSFISTKADMVCNGLLPIDQMRDYRGPISLVCQRIPRANLEHIYNIAIPKPPSHLPPESFPTVEDLLCAFSGTRGYLNIHGRPDEARGARIILKDYVNGKLLYVCPPPFLLEDLDEKQITHVMRDFNAIGVRPVVDEEEQERKRKNRMTNQKRSQVADEDDFLRQERLNRIQHHSTGKRGGQKYLPQSEKAGKPWLEMKKAQKAQKRAIRKR